MVTPLILGVFHAFALLVFLSACWWCQSAVYFSKCVVFFVSVFLSFHMALLPLLRRWASDRRVVSGDVKPSSDWLRAVAATTIISNLSNPLVLFKQPVWSKHYYNYWTLSMYKSVCGLLTADSNWVSVWPSGPDKQIISFLFQAYKFIMLKERILCPYQPNKLRGQEKQTQIQNCPL